MKTIKVIVTADIGNEQHLLVIDSKKGKPFSSRPWLPQVTSDSDQDSQLGVHCPVRKIVTEFVKGLIRGCGSQYAYTLVSDPKDPDNLIAIMDCGKIETHNLNWIMGKSSEGGYGYFVSWESICQNKKMTNVDFYTAFGIVKLGEKS